ncbi:MAG TPA: peptidoglycan DD-metalloendopeptidase family protein [Firmicutes bacterium]|jgi:LysM repeat protein|nr:peptidoglycan DD-metalloendopeptidase family protein [Bacillota bacterium]HHT43656.1 peptidoglycan DD-metalloendopeptidase family protein [Bacillota bacterium]
MHPWRRRRAQSVVTAVLLTAVLSWGAWAQSSLLKRGMRGGEVLALQQLLVELGYSLAQDGIFGAETEGIVKKVQKAIGLTPDGVVGSLTWEALRELQESVVTYTVQRGDNLTKLARRYNTTVAQISVYNSLPNPDRLLPGQVLYIPAPTLAAASLAPANRLDLQWPVQGSVSSGYGYRIHPVLNARHFHGGIDIAAPEGTAVKAAAAGQVVKAGNMGNYGLGVVIDHGSGVTTWYGHNSKLSVRVGDVVKQGQTIALVGKTGLTTGPHLDFRIKIGDHTVDPLQWLP